LDLGFKRFYGNFGDGQWVGTTIESLVPELETLKRTVLTFVDSLYNQVGAKVSAVDKIVEAIGKKIETVQKSVTTIRNAIYALTGKLGALVKGEFLYIKTIKPQLGGIEAYINDVTSMQGINSQILQGSTMAAGIFMVCGGSDPAQIESLIQFIKLFLSEEPIDGEVDVVTERDELDRSIEALAGFDLTGVNSDYQEEFLN
jgi:hypothetical protein